MEYALSTNIKKLSLKVKAKIAFLQGNGEPSLADMQQLNQQLSIMYDIQTVELTDTTQIPNNYKTLIVIAPIDTVNPKYFTQLDNFTAANGRILLALNRVKGDLSTAMGSSIYTGFENWLNQKGIDIRDEFVIDANAGNVMVRQQNGMFVMNTPVKFPYLPIITKFADHPITKGIESVILPFASPIKISLVDSNLHAVNLAVTSDKTGFEKTPVYFDVMKQWTRNDFSSSPLPVAVAVEGKLNNNYTKMVVFGWK